MKLEARQANSVLRVVRLVERTTTPEIKLMTGDVRSVLSALQETQGRLEDAVARAKRAEAERDALRLWKSLVPVTAICHWWNDDDLPAMADADVEAITEWCSAQQPEVQP